MRRRKTRSSKGENITNISRREKKKLLGKLKTRTLELKLDTEEEEEKKKLNTSVVFLQDLELFLSHLIVSSHPSNGSF